MLARVNPKFKITSSKRTIKHLPSDELQGEFFSAIDKDELLTFLLDYTSNIHFKGEFELAYSIIKLQDTKYKVIMF